MNENVIHSQLIALQLNSSLYLSIGISLIILMKYAYLYRISLGIRNDSYG